MAASTVRYLSRADVEAVGLSGVDVVEILDALFRAKRLGRTEMPPKIGVHPREDAFIHAMPAYLGDQDVAGVKWIGGYPDNQALGLPYIHGLLLLTDGPTGRPLAVMDATWITELRTAAASMLGIRALAPGAIETVGVVGCGRQATVHLELATEVFPKLTRARLFDRHPERAEELASALPALEAAVGSSAKEAAAGAELVITTAAIVHRPERPLRREHLRRATVACAIDYDASLSEDVFEDAAIFVVDDLPQYRYHRQLGYFAGYPDEAVELADLLAGEAAPEDGLRVYVPLGIAIEDVAVAAEINRRAAGSGLGRELPL
jgi:ornithine cyclodeaminase/alanine dehydrogenase-like protein (mu-crystallin family)